MNNPKPKIYNNDIKVLGRVVSIATENKLAAAEQVFDEKFQYSELPRYSFDNDNIDITKEGLNQYSINRLLGKKIKKVEDAGLIPGEDGKLHNVKVEGLTVTGGANIDELTVNNNITAGGKITANEIEAINKIKTKDLEVTNRADIKNLYVNGSNINQIIEDKLNKPSMVVIAGPTKVAKGGSVTLHAEVLPTTITDRNVYWQSLTPSIATVDVNTGVVTARSLTGVDAKIRAYSLKDNSVFGEHFVYIYDNTPVNPEPEEPVYHTVTFDYSIIEPRYAEVTVQHGNPVASPGVPVKPGYKFIGWERDGSAYNFNESVTLDITIVAHFEEYRLELTDDAVSFNDPNENVGSHNIQIVDFNENATEQYTWSISNQELANQNVHTKRVISDLVIGDDGYSVSFETLHKGTATITCTGVDSGITRSCTVTIVNDVKHAIIYKNGDATFKTSHVEVGTTIPSVETPRKGDYVFNGWQGLPQDGIMPDDDITVTALWTAPRYELLLNKDSINLIEKGENYGIIATRKTNDVVNSDGTIRWSSSDNNVATVDLNGTVIPHGAGTAVITASWERETTTCTATCNVTVLANRIQPSSVSILGRTEIPAGTTGEVYTAIISPANADIDTEITWEVLEGVGTIHPNGNTCTYDALDRSSVCHLKATTANGKSAQILINVVAPEQPEIHVYDMQVDPTTMSLTVGQTTDNVITAICKDNGVAVSNPSITWTSSNPSTATVSDGVVTPVAAGSTTITATWEGKQKVCIVTVSEVTPPTQYNLTPDFDYWEFKLGQYPTAKTLTLTLNGWENGIAWDLKRSDNSSYNAHTTIGTNDQQIEMNAEADSPNGRQITFSAYIDGNKVGETTVTIVTLPADEPTHNKYTATFFDTGLPNDAKDPYVYGANPNLDYPVGPGYYDNPVIVGTVEFTEGEPSGVWHAAKEGWPDGDDTKTACAAAGVDRIGYDFRWFDSASYAGYMPERDIYLKALWDAASRDIVYMDGNTEIARQTLYTGAVIQPIENPTKEDYIFNGWTEMPADGKVPGTDTIMDNPPANYPTKRIPLIMHASWSPVTNDQLMIEPSVRYIATGMTENFIAKIGGQDVTNDVTWTSSDESIATVNAGSITTIAPGTVTISATDGSNTATCTLMVHTFDPRVEINPDGWDGTMNVGDTREISCTVYDMPAGAYIQWSSTPNNLILSAQNKQNDETVGVITTEFRRTGTATVYATMKDSSGNEIIRDAFEVTVV